MTDASFFRGRTTLPGACTGVKITDSHRCVSGPGRHHPIAELLADQHADNKLRPWQQPPFASDDQRRGLMVICRVFVAIST
jgi:hypothetical protein